MSEVKRYETWEEFPAERISEITVTDAPAGTTLVADSDYDAIEADRDRLVKLIADWAKRLQWADGLDPCIEDMRKEINR